MKVTQKNKRVIYIKKLKKLTRLEEILQVWDETQLQKTLARLTLLALQVPDGWGWVYWIYLI